MVLPEQPRVQRGALTEELIAQHEGSTACVAADEQCHRAAAARVTDGRHECRDQRRRLALLEDSAVGAWRLPQRYLADFEGRAARIRVAAYVERSPALCGIAQLIPQRGHEPLAYGRSHTGGFARADEVVLREACLHAEGARCHEACLFGTDSMCNDHAQTTNAILGCGVGGDQARELQRQLLRRARLLLEPPLRPSGVL